MTPRPGGLDIRELFVEADVRAETVAYRDDVVSSFVKCSMDPARLEIQRICPGFRRTIRWGYPPTKPLISQLSHL